MGVAVVLVPLLSQGSQYCANSSLQVWSQGLGSARA